MKAKRLLYTLVMLLFVNGLAFGKVSDSLSQNEATRQTELLPVTEDSNFEETDDFAPGLFVFAIWGLAFVFICVGAGIVLTVFGLLAVFGLIGAGILSASILIGLNKKSFTKGFKTFLVLATTVGGLIIGMTGFWILNKVTHWWTLKTSLLTGSFSGLLAGLLFGLFAFHIIQKLTTFLRKKLQSI